MGRALGQEERGPLVAHLQVPRAVGVAAAAVGVGRVEHTVQVQLLVGGGSAVRCIHVAGRGAEVQAHVAGGDERRAVGAVRGRRVWEDRRATGTQVERYLCLPRWTMAFNHSRRQNTAPGNCDTESFSASELTQQRAPPRRTHTCTPRHQLLTQQHVPCSDRLVLRPTA